MTRALAVTLTIFLLVFAFAFVRNSPPAAIGRDAPSDRFSAERARDVQRAIAGSGTPRPSGSLALTEAREALVATLRRVGWSVQTQRAFTCSHHGACSWVENVIATLEGATPDAAAVLLSAHYDSVPASPGASDDGVGTAAVVETARALATGQQAHAFVVLLSDGEEGGLLGAKAFVTGHPLAKRVRATINVDARGSSGPSAMFETNTGNAWIVSLVARELPRPVTTSLFYEVYRRMPNDTDFTLLKQGSVGVNFANTARIEHYHTPADSLATADIGTLQHHGDHILAIARALDARLDEAHASGDAVWFDVFALAIVHFPSRWALPLALLALALVVGQTWSHRAVGLLNLVFPAALFAAAGAATAVGAALQAIGAVPVPWVAHPAAAQIALHGASAAGAFGVVLVASTRRRAETVVGPSRTRVVWAGTWLGWGILGVATAIFAPGASYLFIVPTLMAGVVGRAAPTIAAAAPSVVTAILVMPLALALYDALGFAVPGLVCAPTTLLAPTLAPLLVASGADPPRAWSRALGRVTLRRSVLALAATALFAAVAALVVPPFSASVPQRANVVFWQDVSGDARVFIDPSWGPVRWGAPSPAMLAALGDRSRLGQARPFPWEPLAPFAPAQRIDAPPPEFALTSSAIENGSRHIRGRVLSPRGASTLALLFGVPQTAASRPLGARTPTDVTVNGERATVRYNQVVSLTAVPPDGVDVDLLAAGPETFSFTLIDQTSGAPPRSIAEAAIQARPAEVTPSQNGDVTVLAKLFTL